MPGNVVLYVCYVLGLGAALMTAIYMTRMMIYTFHGPNRSGEKEREHLAEAPWVMTGPLVVLGVLSAIGGWLNLPAFLAAGPVESLTHWLEPVTGESALRITLGRQPEMGHSLEYTLVGAAVAIALLGIWIAWSRLKPEHLVPKSRGASFVELISSVASEHCWEDGPNCAACPLAGECPTGQEAVRDGVSGGRAARPKSR